MRSTSRSREALVRRDKKDKTAAEQVEEQTRKGTFDRYIKDKLNQTQIDAYYAFLTVMERASCGLWPTSGMDGAPISAAIFKEKNPSPIIERGRHMLLVRDIVGDMAGPDASVLQCLVQGRTTEYIGRTIDGLSNPNSASGAGLARVRVTLDRLIDVLISRGVSLAED